LKAVAHFSGNTSSKSRVQPVGGKEAFGGAVRRPRKRLGVDGFLVWSTSARARSRRADGRHPACPARRLGVFRRQVLPGGVPRPRGPRRQQRLRRLPGGPGPAPRLGRSMIDLRSSSVPSQRQRLPLTAESCR
jgi:hypothetical protein